MTELERLRKVADEATRYLNGDLRKRTQGHWTHVSLSSGKRGKLQGEEGQNVRIVDENGSEHLVPKASMHLSWAPV